MSLAAIQPQFNPQLKGTLPSYFEVDLEGVSDDSKVIASQWDEATAHYLFPISRETLAQKFLALTSTWRNETAHLSSITQMAMHPAYQQIIGMGSSAIPLILRELEKSPDHWFWALKAITGLDPVDPSEQGKIGKMAEAWIRWGKERAYI